MTRNELWNKFLKYDVRELRFVRVAPSRGFIELRGNFPDGCPSSFDSDVWTFRSCLLFRDRAVRFVQEYHDCVDDTVEPLICSGFYDHLSSDCSPDDLPF